MASLNVPLAFLAGLLSILSPCVFSLVPVYLGYISGASMIGMGTTQPNRWRVVSHALAFVLGFTLIFVIVLGLPTTLLSNVLHRYSIWITRIGGVLLILFGLHTLHVVTIPLFNVTKRAQFTGGLSQGYLRSMLFGATFASGWSPCVGPLLGLVLTLSFTAPGRAMVFLLVYALGIATPFLLAAVLLSQMMGFMEKLTRHARTIEWISGGLMLVVGLLMVTGLFNRLNDWLILLTPDWLLPHL
ncbi:MAG: cytochrome c biogenesis protein CcdA [Anaerolineae bacterium]|nr:cytochrome c biogenesis protein CcdA [Anaerolineae bacterium]